jgi:Polyketide cyclase / dehydrase and lipid transport
MKTIIPELRFALAIALFALAGPAFAAPAQDVVVRVTRDGSTFMVEAEFSVTATQDEAWDVLTDFDHMSQILSNVDASRIMDRDGNRFQVVQKSHAQAGLLRVSLDSVRQVELTPKTEIKSRILKSNDLKSSDFTTRLAEEGGLIKVTVRGSFVPMGLAAAAANPDAVEANTRRQYSELRDEIVRRKNHEPTPPCILAKNCPQG